MYAAIFGYTGDKILILILHIVSEINKSKEAQSVSGRTNNMEIKKFLDDYKKISKTEVIGFLKEHADEDLTSAVLGRAFERLYIDGGYTADAVDLSELVNLHHSFSLGNGGGWCRGDEGSYLGRKYIVINGKTDGRITSISIDGYKTHKSTAKTKKISTDTLKELVSATECYKAMRGALLMDGDELDEETRKDAERVCDRYEKEMLKLIDLITKGM